MAGVHADEHSWLSNFAFLMLTYNSGLAAYRSVGDPWMVGFVVGSYVDLLSLLYFLRLLEKTPEGSPRRGPLKAVVWSLATVLTAMFAHKVAAIMPWAVQLIIWGMAAATIIGGFYAYFIYSDKSSGKEKKH